MITLSPLVIVLVAVSALMLLLLILNHKNAQRQAEQAEAEWEKERLYLERQFAQQHDELQRHLNEKAQALQLSEQQCRQTEQELVRQQTLRESAQQHLQDVKQLLLDKEHALSVLNENYTYLLSEHTELKAVLTEKQRVLEQQKLDLEQSRQQLKTEFHYLANQILDEKNQVFNQQSQVSIARLLQPFREQIEGFQRRVNEVHAESLKGNVVLESEIRKVLDIGMKMSEEASMLAGALKGDKKLAGNWGEAQLEQTLQLAGLLRDEHYQAQAVFKSADGSTYYPDFVINLPDGKHLIIDSKVSLIDYSQAVAATDDASRLQALQAHVKAVRNHIDNLASKDYSNLCGMNSPGFVLMFMPVEPAYIAALQYGRDLFNYGYEKKVILVSHTTLMPVLRTVSNLWMIERSNSEAQEITARAGEIYNQVCVVAENLQRLGNTLTAASNHYNKTVTALAGRQGLHGKVERFQRLSSNITRSMPVLEPLNADFEQERLAMMTDSGAE